jgi:hypothetical protein
MDTLEKQALQVAKEIVVKFIEVGRISPANFAEHFGEIYAEIHKTVSTGPETPPAHKKKDKAD